MTNQVNNQSLIPSTEVIQLTFNLKMTTTQVVETSVTIQDYVDPDDHAQPTNETTPGFKPFIMKPVLTGHPRDSRYC